MAPDPTSGGVPEDSVGVVVLGAGESRRMEGTDKVFAPLYHLPVIAHSIRVFNDCPQVLQVVLVLSPPRIEEGRALVTRYGSHKAAEVCPGGARRQDSVRAGLERLTRCAWVMVHDGSRPLVDAKLLARGLDAARETGAAVAAVPAKDTIKVVSEGGLVKETPSRDHLWQVQTPQVFRYELLMEAHRRCDGDYTDDGAMVESLGVPVKVFRGSYGNIKITTPEDLLIAETLMRWAKGGSSQLCL